MKDIKDMEENKDAPRFFTKIWQLVKINKEVILYLVFGGLAFFVSIITYALFEKILGFLPLVANLFSWVITVTFAYITNRIWVFESHVKDFNGILKELVAFFGGRVVTLLIEEGVLFMGINMLSIDSIVTKIAAQIVVIVSNYFISKLIVFKKK